MKFIKILTAEKLISRRENNLELGLRYHCRQSRDNVVFFLGSLMPICLRKNWAIRLRICSWDGHGNAQQVSRLKSLIKFRSNFLKVWCRKPSSILQSSLTSFSSFFLFFLWQCHLRKASDISDKLSGDQEISYMPANIELIVVKI